MTTKRDPNDAKTDGQTLGAKAKSYDYFAATGRRAKGVLAVHPPKHGQRILDVGCGTGTLTIMLKRVVGDEGYVAGVDAAAKMIAVAKGKAETKGVDVDFRIAAIEAMPFEDNSFDGAYATLMTHHLPLKTKIAGFKEVLRVLKPGGTFMVLDFGKPENIFVRALFHPIWLMEKYFVSTLDAISPHVKGELPDILSNAGFTGVRRLKKSLGLLEYVLGEKS